jgi:hypothetical protein
MHEKEREDDENGRFLHEEPFRLRGIWSGR